MILDEHCGYGGGFGGGGLLIVIALIVLFAAFRGGIGGYGHDGGYAGAGAGYGGFTAAADMMTMNRYANYEDRDIASIQKQNAVDTGLIIKNQDTIAMNQERLFLQNQIQELRDGKLALEGKLFQQETLNAIGKSNCELNHRLDQIQCEMLKRPPVWGLSVAPASSPCGGTIPFAGFERGFDGFNGNARGCC